MPLLIDKKQHQYCFAPPLKLQPYGSMEICVLLLLWLLVDDCRQSACVHCVQLDFWHEASEKVHALVPPEQLDHVKRHLVGNGVSYEVLNDHIQRRVSAVFKYSVLTAAVTCALLSFDGVHTLHFWDRPPRSHTFVVDHAVTSHVHITDVTRASRP